MNVHLARRQAMLALLIVSLATVSSAGMFDFFAWGPFARFSSKNRIDTLVITGNFARSRLLAELAQRHNKQPILLISSTDRGDEIFFLPSGPDAMPLDPARLQEFVDWAQPKRVVILGDSSYVNDSYIKMFRNHYPIVTLSGTNWMQNAMALGEIIGSKNLAKDYRQLLLELETATARRSGGFGSDMPPAPLLSSEPIVGPSSFAPRQR